MRRKDKEITDRSEIESIISGAMVCQPEIANANIDNTVVIKVDIEVMTGK